MKLTNWIKKTYPALYHAGFRLYFFASIIGMLGLWIDITAQQWLVYTLTDSAMKLGLLGAMQFLPTLLFSLHAGVIVDRANKRALVIFTQTMRMISALILGILVWTDTVQYWHVLLLALGTGLVTTFDMPARQALIPELVGERDLRSAINLLSICINLARFLGPAIGAFLIHGYGIAICFFINGLAFIPVIFAIYKVKPEIVTKKKPVTSKIFQDIKDGIIYAKSVPEIRYPLATMGIVSMMLWNFVVTMPLFAGHILHGSVTAFGVLMATFGAGSLLGAFIASTFFQGKPDLKGIFIFCIGFHFAYFITGFSYTMEMASIGFIVMGVFNILFLNSTNAIVQMSSAHEYRGRVMSLFSLVFFGMSPMGSLFTGWFLEWASPALGIRLLPVLSAVLIGLVLYALRDKRIPIRRVQSS